MPVKGMDMDIKWIVILALVTSGTNAMQYLGFSQPEAKTAAEAQSANELIRDELRACMKELRECYGQCGQPSSTAWDMTEALEYVAPEPRITIE